MPSTRLMGKTQNVAKTVKNGHQYVLYLSSLYILPTKSSCGPYMSVWRVWTGKSSYAYDNEKYSCGVNNSEAVWQKHLAKHKHVKSFCNKPFRWFKDMEKISMNTSISSVNVFAAHNAPPPTTPAKSGECPTTPDHWSLSPKTTSQKEAEEMAELRASSPQCLAGGCTTEH